MDYLKANPNATDRTLAQQMDYFGIKPLQVAQVTGMENQMGDMQGIDRRYNMAKDALPGSKTPNPFSVAQQNAFDSVTGKSIQDYFAKNPGMTDQQIALYMDQNQIDPAQMERAFAGTAGAISAPDVFARYQEARKPPPDANTSFSNAARNLNAERAAAEQKQIQGVNASFSNAARNLNAERGVAPPVAFPANGGNFDGYDFIYDAPLPEGMMGTMGGTGYDPVTGRMDLGTAGGSGQYVRRAEEPKKLMNMGGIASLRSGGYPRRTGQINGPGTATSDSIPAMLSDGEFVMTAKAVRGAGKGDRRAGAKRMYALMNQLEKNAARG